MGNISIFIIRVWLVIIFITVSSCCKKDKIEVVDLRCCNLVNPEGIDRTLFSWKIKTDLSNTKQNSWEIEIANTKEALRNGNVTILFSALTRMFPKPTFAP